MIICFVKKSCVLGMVYVMLGCSFVQFTSKKVLTKVSVTRMQMKQNSPVDDLRSDITQENYTNKKNMGNVIRIQQREQEIGLVALTKMKINSIRRTTNLGYFSRCVLDMSYIYCHVLDRFMSLYMRVSKKFLLIWRQLEPY